MSNQIELKLTETPRRCVGLGAHYRVDRIRCRGRGHVRTEGRRLTSQFIAP